MHDSLFVYKWTVHLAAVSAAATAMGTRLGVMQLGLRATLPYFYEASLPGCHYGIGHDCYVYCCRLTQSAANYIGPVGSLH